MSREPGYIQARKVHRRPARHKIRYREAGSGVGGGKGGRITETLLWVMRSTEFSDMNCGDDSLSLI